MKASIVARKNHIISKIDDRLYGAFLEHLGRAVYQGIYEPDHPTADKDGMRGDVAELVRELQVPMVRYPGGNFVSAYNWEDGIGPQEERPVRFELAWHSLENNHVGIHEFAAWAATVNTEMMLAINLGSRGLAEARNFVEYVNGQTGTHWGDLRAANGNPDPWNVRVWCLGNEMDGPWQVGHKTADEYGRLANETAKALRAFDRNLELIVCGSSNADMATYPEWERVVLEHTYENVDYISLHMYFANYENDIGNFLSLSHKLETYIETVAATIKFVKAKKRSKKDVYISFDEWNVWYHSKEHDKALRAGLRGWPYAPAALEDIYNFEDALQVGCVLNSFIRHSDVVKLACIAQLVNAIAPIMTVTGGPAWKQPIYYPYYFASVFGRGSALDLIIDCPTYDSAIAGGVSYADAAGVDNEDGTLSFFLINRNGGEALDVEIDLQGYGAATIIAHEVMTNPDLKAVNSPNNPDAVVPHKGNGASVRGATLSVSLPPHSYQMVRIQTG